MKHRPPKKQKQAMSPVVESIIHSPPSHTDPQGMYTGKPWNENDEPVQDADDL